jgi:hypothetical protein
MSTDFFRRSLANHEQKKINRLTQSAQDEQDKAAAIKPTFYDGYNPSTGLHSAHEIGNESIANFRVIANNPYSAGDQMVNRPSISRYSRLDDQYLIKPQAAVATDSTLYLQKEGVAADLSGSISLTNISTPLVNNFGALRSVSRLTNTTWTLTFSFRIFGSTTTYFADGLVVAITSNESLIYNEPRYYGVSNPLSAGEAVIGIDTFRNTGGAGGDNASRPRVYAITAGQDENTTGIPVSSVSSGLRSTSWQSATVSYDGVNLIGTFGGLAVTLPVALSNTNWLRIASANGYNDNHEVKDIMFNGVAAKINP